MVAAAKRAAFLLVRSIHVEEFGLAQEVRLIAEAKGLAVHVQKKRLPGYEHATAYWIVDRLAAFVVRSMYDRKLWVLR
jgi:hypothetical protein